MKDVVNKKLVISISIYIYILKYNIKYYVIIFGYKFIQDKNVERN